MHTTRIVRLLAPAALLMFASAAFARGAYQEPEEFVRAAFGGSAPPAQLLWLTTPVAAETERILGHPPAQRRIRYWQQGARSAWVLEEIGKEELITTGIVVDRGRIAQVAVLAYRESRGGEVRYPRFTGQFHGAALTAGHELDRPIDGISGATLSVWALTKMARLALYFDGLARAQS